MKTQYKIILFVMISVSSLGLKPVYAADEACMQIRLDLDNNYESDFIDEIDSYSPGYKDGNPIAPDAFPQQIRACAEICNEDVADRAVREGVSVDFAFVNGPSWYPGVAMNYPRGNPDTGDDITLLDKSVPFKLYDGRAIACARLEVNDYGVFSELAAQTTITLEMDEPLYLVDNQTIPKDEDDNKIADVDPQNAICGKNILSALKDNDDEPVGDGTAGDGLSCVEEWRGFINSENKHVRTDPTKKNLFIAHADGGLSGAGFLGVTELKIIYLSEDQMNGRNSRVVNFNNIGTFHLVDQHGLFVKTSHLKNGVLGDSNPSSKTFNSPKDVGIIEIDREAIASLCERYVDCQQALEETLSHELGHGIGIHHHSNDESEVDKIMVNGKERTIVSLNGNASGDTSCFMRYRFYRGFYDGSHETSEGKEALYGYYPRDHVDGKAFNNLGGDQAEGLQTQLCTSTQGTGVNTLEEREVTYDGYIVESIIGGEYSATGNKQMLTKTGDSVKSVGCQSDFRVNDNETK